MDGDPLLDGALPTRPRACAKARCRFEIVPGVSPLTGGPGVRRRRAASAASAREVHVVDADDPGVDWAAHADPRVTVVVLGGADRAAEVARALVAAGRAADDPGRRHPQRHHDRAAHRGHHPRRRRPRREGGRAAGPGAGRRRRDRGPRATSCRGSRPSRCSAGACWCRAPRSRPARSASSCAARRRAASRCRPSPSSRRAPRSRWSGPSRAWSTAATSGSRSPRVNAVRAVREKFDEFGLDARAFAGVKVAAVGEPTAAALRAFGVSPDLVPCGEQSSPGLLDDLPEFDAIFDPVNRVFLPRADIATETLAAGLRRARLGGRGRHRLPHRARRTAAAETREAIKTGGFDAVLFTSSSTVRNLVGIAGKPHASTVVACIGPATAEDRGGARPAGRRARRDAVGRRRWPRRSPSTAPRCGSRPPRPASRCGGRASVAAPPVARRPDGAGFPAERPRRLRRTPALRRLVARDLAAPGRPRAADVRRARALAEPVADRVDARRRAAHARLAARGGGRGGRGRRRRADALRRPGDARRRRAPAATDPDGILNVALRDLRDEVGDDLVLMADLCLDEFTDHGHCGVLDADGRVDNDATLARYARWRWRTPTPGADVVGPSGMMDGQVGASATAWTPPAAQRRARSSPTPPSTPRRSTARSARPSTASSRATAAPTSRTRPTPRGAARGRARPRGGRRHRHGQAGRPYLDVVREAADAVDVPVAAYQVSGEYAMVEAAAANGWIDRDRAVLESLTSIRRAGADIVLTYWAAEAARWIARGARQDHCAEPVPDPAPAVAGAVRARPGRDPRRRELPGPGVPRRRWHAALHGPRAAARLTDADGRDYVDLVCSWGPMILGHAHPAVVEAVAATRRRAASRSAPRPRARCCSPRRSWRACRRSSRSGW